MRAFRTHHMLYLALIILQACHPFSAEESSVESNFHPGINANLPHTWSFQNPSDYIFDSRFISLSGGSCRLNKNDQTDDDASAYGFGGGTPAGIQVSSKIQLGSDGTCTGLSKNISDLDSCWTPSFNHLVGYWKFNEIEGTSTSTDYSPGGTNTATMAGAVMGNSGKNNGGASMNGTFTSISLANTFPTGAYTKSAWVNLSSVATLPNIISSPNNFCHALYISSGFLTGYQEGSNYVSDPTPMQTGKWIHTAITFDPSINSGELRLFRNGVQVAYADHVPTQTCSDVAIGVFGNVFQTYFTGTIDDAAIWDTALTPTDIKKVFDHQSVEAHGESSGYLTSRIMDAGQSQSWTSLTWNQANPSTQTNLLTNIQGLWHADDASGAGASDSSGHGHNISANACFKSMPGRLDQSLTSASGYCTFELPAPVMSDNDEVTLSSWVYLTADTFSFSVFNGTADGIGIYIGDTAGGSGHQVAVITGAQNYSNLTPVPSLQLNQWYHLALTRNTAGNTILYVNGLPYANGSTSPLPVATVTSAIAVVDPNARVDEIGLWKRVLSPDEMKALYLQGANRVKFQVKACAQADCSDAEWQGPSGNSESFFQSLTANSSSLSSLSGRYFQYRAILENDDSRAGFLPEVNSVSVGPTVFNGSHPSITSRASVSYQSLSQWTETLSSNGCSAGVTYQLGVGADVGSAIWYYWDTTWQIASGTNGTLAPAIQSHLATFPNTAGTGKLFLRAFLNSSADSACELNSLMVDGI